MADDSTTRAELDRLYWETDESVAAIADRLDISRRALYDGIEARPTGVACSDCGAPLVYRNRTARDNREAECPECGREVGLGDAEGFVSDPESEQYDDAASLSPVQPVVPGAAGPLLGFALLTGLAVGAIAVYRARRG
ncbi:MAG: hypothetical protein P8177_10670 [Gemmatimonadota bacterium]|jgi:DNA-directed RNA polymerase subunit RPC12/RpoP